jgi:hypothetical protein
MFVLNFYSQQEVAFRTSSSCFGIIKTDTNNFTRKYSSCGKGSADISEEFSGKLVTFQIDST